MRYVPERSGAVLDTRTDKREYFGSFEEAMRVAAELNAHDGVSDLANAIQLLDIVKGRLDDQIFALNNNDELDHRQFSVMISRGCWRRFTHAMNLLERASQEEA